MGSGLRVAAEGGEDFGHAAAFDELHGVIVDAALATDCVDRNDVGVLEGRGGASFVLEAGKLALVEHGGERENLEGDTAAERELLGFVDHAHAAAADLAEDTEVAERSSFGLRFFTTHPHPALSRRERVKGVELGLSKTRHCRHGGNQLTEGFGVLSMLAGERFQVEAFAGDEAGGDLFEEAAELGVEGVGVGRGGCQGKW
jgi:hypothetical protein